MKNSTENFIKKLEDASLESVSGGGEDSLKTAADIGTSGVLLTGVSVLSGIGCGIANTVCQYRAKHKRAQGDIKSAEKLEKASRVLGGTALGIGVVGSGIGIGMVAYGVSSSSIASSNISLFTEFLFGEGE